MIQDTIVLAAIGCHTTLKRDAGVMDKVLFVADKIAWDQVGAPPYAEELEQALGHSLDAAVCVYLRFLWDQRAALPVVHPWLVDAFHDLCV